MNALYGKSFLIDMSLQGSKLHVRNNIPLYYLGHEYSSTRASFMKKIQEFLEDDYEDFESLGNVEKSSYVLGSELWESKFDGLLSLVEEYIVDMGNTKT